MTSSKVPVLEYTLMRRINRLLALDGRKLVKNKKTRSKSNKRKRTAREIEFGRYFVVRDPKTDRARVVEKHVDLVEFGRRNGVLEPYETLAPLEE